MDWRLVFVLLLIESWCVVMVKCNVVFKVEHVYGGRGQGREALATFRYHDSVRHARMLGAVDIPLGGDAKASGAGLYFTKIRLGTPPNDYHLQVDTGSDVLWLNCKGCQNCATKTNLNIQLKQYDMAASSTAKKIACDEDFCRVAVTNRDSQCKVGTPCDYAVAYADHSVSSGYFVNDTISLDQVTGNLQNTTMNGSIGFGCSVKQAQGASSAQALDGLVGFGQSNVSLLSQLASAGKVKKVFSHCLDGNKGSGIFAVGEVVQPKVNVTPLVEDEVHYNIILKSVAVGGQVLDLPKSIFDLLGTSRRKAVLDTGTTLAYLPADVYEPLLKKILEKQPNLNIYTAEQLYECFSYNGNVNDGFPVVTFNFEGSLSLQVYPSDYLFTRSDKEYCFGWQHSLTKTSDGKEIMILGDFVLANKLIVHDLENQTIGWTPYNCSSSIQVRDSVSGKVFNVSAHNLSLAFNQCKVDFISIFALVAVLLNLLG